MVNNETVLFNIQYVQRYTLIEVLFANFLKYKGYKVKGLVCAGHNYCEIYSSNNEKPNCQMCRAKSFSILKAGKIEFVDLKAYKKSITNKSDHSVNFNLSELKNYNDLETNFPIGETTYWNWLHYSNGAIIPQNTKKNEKVLYDIYTATVQSYETIKAAIIQHKPSRVITCNGKFCQTRPAYFLKDVYNYECITWEHFPQGDNFVWLKNAYAMDHNISNYWNNISESTLSDEETLKVSQNFAIQESGKDLPFKSTEKINVTQEGEIYEALKIKKDKLIFSIFPNVAFDSPALGQGIDELDMFDTLNLIIKNAPNYKNIQFIIRAHPAEINVPDYLKASINIADALKEQNLNIPDNVFLIDSKSKISSYSICALSDEIFFFSTTLGIEMLHKGHMISTLGGKSYYANKGISHDIHTKTQLHNFFQNSEKIFIEKGKRGMPPKLSEDQKRKVNILSFYIRFKLRVKVPIVSRGILILTFKNYRNYLNYFKNLLEYIEDNRDPFDFNLKHH